MAIFIRKFTIPVSCIVLLLLLLMANVSNATYSLGLDNSRTPRQTLLNNEAGSGLFRTLQHMFDQCLQKKDMFWCFKIQGSRLLGRALKFTNIQIIDGISLVKRVTNHDNDDDDDGDGNHLESGRSQGSQSSNLSNRDLENLSLKSLDSLLAERFNTFIRSRQVQVNMPRLLAFGKRSSQELWNTVFDPILKYWSMEEGSSTTVRPENLSIVEGRKKKGGQSFFGPFVAAVLLKTAILKMAYHSIAIVAGKALIVGKIALIISAIIGLKKLVSSDGEKTTYEIVKHPQVSQSHTYSSSHAGDYEGGHEGGGGGGGGSYHRSMDDEMMMQDKAYNAWVPSHPSSLS